MICDKSSSTCDVFFDEDARTSPSSVDIPAISSAVDPASIGRVKDAASPLHPEPDQADEEEACSSDHCPHRVTMMGVSWFSQFEGHVVYPAIKVFGQFFFYSFLGVFLEAD